MSENEKENNEIMSTERSDETTARSNDDMEPKTHRSDLTDAIGTMTVKGVETPMTSPVHSNSYGNSTYGQIASDPFISLSNYHKRSSQSFKVRHLADYNMRHKNRGMAIIFNNEYFDCPKLKFRTGSKLDTQNLKTVFENLQFTVTVHTNFYYKDIFSALKKAASEDHTDNDCIVVVILSHGELGYIHARDEQYKLESLLNLFTAENCPSLAVKPKLFFIQACQGKLRNPGVTMLKDDIETDGASRMSFKIPVHADFLIAFSTIPGFYSWRNSESGSWFIQSLCAELSSNGKFLDILTLLTFVCQRVAVDYESYVPEKPDKHQLKQMPCITTMLTRTLLFTDKQIAQSEPV